MGRNIFSGRVEEMSKLYVYKLERFTWRQLTQVPQAGRSWHNRRPLRLPKSCPGLRESIWDMAWLVTVMSNQADLPGHCSSGRTYWTGSGAVGTSQKDCCRRSCQVPGSLLFVEKACKNRQKDLFVVFQEWSACLQGRDGHPAEAHLGGLLPCLYLSRRFNVRLGFPTWIYVWLCNDLHLEQNK